MKQYIDKSALIAEIKRITDEQQEICKADVALGKAPDSKNIEVIYQFQQFTKFLDTLEVKEIGVDIGSPEDDYNSKTIQFIDADGNIKEITFNKAQNGKSALETANEEKVDNQNCVKLDNEVESKFKVGDKVYELRNGFECTIESIDETTYYGDTTNFDIKDQDNWELVEQKSADKVEPKFHKGEWIVHQGTDNVYQVVAVIDNQYQLKYGDNYTVQKCADVDRCARLWDITKDAKDGDVLAVEPIEGYYLPFIAIYKERGFDFFNSHCFIGFDGIFYNGDTGHSIDNIHPATKEQRNVLMKAMTDAGYTFDFEKKELMKIEQKPVIEMKTPEESLCVDSDTYNKIVDECVYGEQKPVWSQDVQEEQVNEEFINALGTMLNDGLPDRYLVSEERIKKSAELLFSIARKQLKNEMQEWSEEDRKRIQRISNFIWKNRKGDTDDIYQQEQDVKWLKSLRPQNNITDEELAQAKKDVYNDVLNKIEYHSGEPTFDDGWSAAIWYLKKRNAMPQNKWKPSDEQMKALWNVYQGGKEQAELATLYNDLKKLKE